MENPEATDNYPGSANSLSDNRGSKPYAVKERANLEGAGIPAKIWGGFRPYLVRFSVDFLVSGTLWVMLFLFKSLTKLLEIPAPVSEFIITIQSVGVVLVFVLFGVLFIIDIYALHKSRDIRTE